MDLSRFPEKQKRCHDWLRFVNKELQDPSLKEPTLKRIRALQKVLANCWEAKAVTPQEHEQISTLERELEQLNQEARVRVVPAAKV